MDDLSQFAPKSPRGRPPLDYDVMINAAFPPTAEASEALEAFKQGDKELVIIKVEKGQMALKAHEDSATVDDFAALVEPHAPCYCMYSWFHERAGESLYCNIFIYCCPKEKMKESERKPREEYLETLAKAGLYFSMNLELDPSEVTEGILFDKVYDDTSPVISVTFTKAGSLGLVLTDEEGEPPVIISTVNRGGAGAALGIKEGSIIVGLNEKSMEGVNRLEMVEILKGLGRPLKMHLLAPNAFAAEA